MGVHVSPFAEPERPQTGLGPHSPSTQPLWLSLVDLPTTKAQSHLKSLEVKTFRDRASIEERILGKGAGGSHVAQHLSLQACLKPRAECSIICG